MCRDECGWLIGLLLLFVTVVFPAGAAEVVGVSPAVDNELTARARLGNISASLQNASVIAGKKGGGKPETAGPVIAVGKDSKMVVPNGKPKTKRIVIASVLIFMLFFVFLNLLSLGNNSRMCSNCGYSGGMKGVLLSGNKLLNSAVIFLVTIFPILLYYYAEKGKFVCPRCGRTSANVTVKSRLRDLE